jgi:DNA-binding LacI/PurR family transcriptional regulator
VREHELRTDPEASPNSVRLRSRRARLTVGLLVNWLGSDYASALLNAIAQASEHHDMNVICFAGGALFSPDDTVAQRNVCYEFASPELLDGLLIMTLGGHADANKLGRYCERYRPLPMCSIGIACEGIPGVQVDNTRGMKDAIVHLIEVHGLRRIAFVRGPELNEEAEVRFRAYQQCLGERGLELDPELVLPGNFEHADGAQAVHRLLERQVPFEAVVAANDHMALGVLEALEEHRIEVPGQVAVIGFDDVEQARYAIPGLTTVRQPLGEQANLAMNVLLTQLRGKAVPKRMIVDAKLVIRQSCGCHSEAMRAVALTDVIGASGAEVSFSRPPEPRPSAMRHVVRSSVSPSARQNITDAFQAEVHGGQAGAFVGALGSVLRKAVGAGEDVGGWHAIISELRRQTLPQVSTDTQRWLRTENLLQQARILVGEALESQQGHQRLRAEHWAHVLAETGVKLIGKFDVTALTEALRENLSALGVSTSFLVVYEGPRLSTKWSRLALAYDATTGVELSEPGRRFPAQQLLPPDVLPGYRRYTLIVQPLFFEHDQLGTALFELAPCPGYVYEAIREYVSASLKGAQLVRRLAAVESQRQGSAQPPSAL